MNHARSGVTRRRTLLLACALLMAFASCGCFATFDTARVQDRTRGLAAITVVRNEEGERPTYMPTIGIREGSTRTRFEFGAQAEFWMNPDNPSLSDAAPVINADVKYQFLVDRPDACVRIRGYVPYLWLADLSVAASKRFGGHELYAEVGRSMMPELNYHDSATEIGGYIAKFGDRIQLTPSLALYAEAGYKFRLATVGIGLEF